MAGLSETRYETAGHPCEPYLVALLPLLLDAWADAKEPVRLAAGARGGRAASICKGPAITWSLPPPLDSAEKASRTLVDMTSPHAMGIVLPMLYEVRPGAPPCLVRSLQTGLPPLLQAMTDIKKKWQTRRGGIILLGALAHRAPTTIAESVPAIIPIISECMRDVRKEVVTTAEEVRRCPLSRSLSVAASSRPAALRCTLAALHQC